MAKVLVIESDSVFAAVLALVAGGEAVQRQVPSLARGSSRWRSSPHEPQSLFGVLPLLHPPDA